MHIPIRIHLHIHIHRYTQCMCVRVPKKIVSVAEDCGDLTNGNYVRCLSWDGLLFDEIIYQHNQN